MRLTLVPLAWVGLALTGAEAPAPSPEAAIREVIETFRTCIVQKDQARFLSLFHGPSIPWVSVWKEDALRMVRKKEPETSRADALEADGPGKFIRWIVANPQKLEEKFWNIQITTDGAIASVTFEYSFHMGDYKANWGQEHWHLLNTDKGWKITSVIWSAELNPEPPPPAKP